MTEPFVLAGAGGKRWVVHPPQDPYRDGYVWTVATELHDGGLAAATVAELDGVVEGSAVVRLPAFFAGLAEGWAGWAGVRRWRALEECLEVEARHDGRGYVTVGVTLRADSWSARSEFRLEAGEEMSRLAADLRHRLSPGT